MPSIVIPNETATIVLQGRAYTALSTGDYTTLTFPNAKTARVNGANGGLNVAPRADANVCDFVIRVEKFSEDDVVLNSARNQAAPVVFNGSIKQAFTRDGVDGLESWLLENGTLTAQPTETKNNVDGNAIVEYTIQFRNAVRNM